MPSDGHHDDLLPEFDWIDGIKARVGRAAAIGIPIWLVLLFLFPFTGMGALPCMMGATLITAGVVLWADRRRERRARAEGAGERRADAPRRPMGPLTAAALTLGGVLLVAYVLFIIVTASRGA